LKVINTAVKIPYSDKSGWDLFGDKYDAVDLIRKDISDECLEWLDSIGLKPINCTMLTVFPEKTPPIVIDSNLCEQDNHSRLYWVYDAPLKIMWYEVSVPLGIENIDDLVGVKPDSEEDKFTGPFTGWYPKPEVLVKKGEVIVKPNTCVLVNAGSPILAVSTTDVRSKVFAIGILQKDRSSFGSNGIKFEEAIKIVV
jgi:hypothetical protein